MANKYLKGLSALRFYAALLVLLYHGVEHLEDLGIFSLSNINIFHQGNTAVDFFFVLSGFLISYLAIYEIKEKTRVNFKLFFLRRVFRIMPLYYATFIVMFVFTGFVYPVISGSPILNFPLLKGALCYVFMLPNLVMPLWKVSILNIFWSIGVEEQFYLLFPLVIVLSYKIKNKVIYFSSVLLIYFAFYFYIKINQPFNSVLNGFIGTLKFHFMLLGMLFALLSHKYLIDAKTSVFKTLIENQCFNFLVFTIVFIKLFFIVDDTSIFKDAFSGILYAFLIICVAFNSTVKYFDYKVFNLISYFGAISYGIYLLHPLVSYPLRYIVETNSALLNMIKVFPGVYLLMLLLLTLIVAHLSYNYFEKIFLKLKNNFN